MATAACGKEGHAPGQQAAPSSAVPASATPAQFDLPLCESVEPVAPAAARHADCRLVPGDGSGSSLVVRYTIEAGTASESVVEIDSVGVEHPVVTESGINIQISPRLTDLDADGRDDLILPRDTVANGNATYVIYRSTTSGFVRAGTLSGFGPERTDTGYVAVAAKGGARFWNIGFWRFDNASQLVAEAFVEIESEQKPGGTGRSTCRITDSTGHATTNELGSRFCGEPIVHRHTPFK
ncbi:hypothetical protein AB0J48_35625 [Nocardia salmonicida]|uniref:hypothetical protein n=1 Tax=Nocardia salmonicida TaxID=53431 RepID=UPI003414D78F